MARDGIEATTILLEHPTKGFIKPIRFHESTDYTRDQAEAAHFPNTGSALRWKELHRNQILPDDYYLLTTVVHRP